MVLPRLGFRAALLRDGSILVVGNEPCVAAGEPTESQRAEVYDPATDAWSEVGSLNKDRAKPALVALLDGRAMVLGGTNLQSQAYSSTKIYTPAARTWTDGPLMQRAGASAAVTLMDGRVVAVGPGRAEILDPALAAWRRTIAPPSLLSVDRLLLLADGKVLAVGDTAESTSAFLTFDPDQGSWAAMDPPVVNRPVPVVLADGSLLALGDDEGGGHVERYDPTKGTWTEPAQMTQGRIRAQTALLGDGRLLVIGGVPLLSQAVEGGYQVTEGPPLTSTEIYDPATDSWSAGPSLRSARQGGQAITLTSGSVIVFGGYEQTPEDTNPDTGTPGPCPTPLATTERLASTS